MFKFRDYQSNGIRAVYESWREGKRRVMLVAPPGAGKGSLIGAIASKAAKSGTRVLFVVHKKELVVQTAKRMMDQFGYGNYGHYLSGHKQEEKPIMFGSIQTIARRNIAKNFGLVIIDECHRLKTKQYQSFYHTLGDKVYTLGLTATPFRTDKKGFKKEFDVLIQLSKYMDLVDKKYLVRNRYVAPDVAPNLDGLHLRGGEFVSGEVVDKFNDNRVYNAFVDKWIELGENRKTIVFNTSSMVHSENTMAAFRERGIEAHAINSKDSPEKRKDIYNAFVDSKFPILGNIGLFTEGISIDDTMCIAFNTATNSLQKWVQACARGSRPLWNEDFTDWRKGPDGLYLKTDCLVLDFGGNVDRHGHVEFYDMFGFSLDGTPPKQQVGNYKKCPECGEVVVVQVRSCPGCGYVWPVEEKDKAFADEVEWKEIPMVKGLAKRMETVRFNDMMRKLATSPAPEWLRTIGVVRGYHHAWAANIAYQLGYISVNPGKDPKKIARVLNFLKKAEKDKGLDRLYQAATMVYGK